MSSSFTRMLRRLYPRHVRDRYGDELLELQDELRARGEISRAGLLRDALAGAILARTARQRVSFVLSAATVTAGLVVIGLVITGGSGLTRTDASTHLLAKVPRALTQTLTKVPGASPPAAQPSHSCFTTTNGRSCALTACAEYIELNPTTGDIVASGTAPEGEQPQMTHAKCAASPIPRPLVLPISKYSPQ